MTFTNDCEDLTNNTANYHHQHHSHQSKIHRTKHHKIVNSERKHDSPCSKQIPKSYETNNLNGVILRSGRTQEDYEEARELARNLMKKTPCITPPSSLSSDRKGRTSNPLIPLLRNDQSPGIKNYIYESSAYNNSGFSTKKLFSPNSISSSNSNSREHGSSWSQNSYLNNDHGDETPLGGEENNFQHRLNSQSKIQYDHISIHSPNSLQANKTANHSRNNLKPTTGAMTNDKSNKFCSECGSTFPSTAARFCPECGMRRMGF
ncbi:unnamed protein product [Trichobilharzia regenti]|nr:unnamed protein product [Trichobilharzia regenti]